MNKVIKFVLLVLFSVISFSAANITKNELADSKITKIYNVQSYRQIFLPSSVDTNKEFVSLVKGVSEKTGTPFLFRSVYIGTENSNNGTPNLLKGKNEVTFFRTNSSPRDKKIILSHGFTYEFLNEALSKISSVQLENSDFYISSKNLKKNLQEFSKELNQKYNLKTNPQKLTIRPNDYPPTSSADFISYDNSNLIFFITVSMIFFTIFLYVWLVDNNRTISIYRLNGLSAYKIGRQLFLKEFTFVSLVTYMIASLIVFRSFNFDYTIQMLLFSALVVVLSYVSIAVVSSFSLINQLNSKPFFKYSYYILYAVKAFVFLVTVSTTASLLYFVNANIATTSKIGQEYAVLYPEYVGYGLNSTKKPLSFKLFEYAENHKGLYVNLMSANGGNDDVLQVNDNYLSKFAIISTDNKRIKINPQEKSGIVLIAEKDKLKLSQIKKEYSFVDSFNSSKINYYFIKDNQKVELLDGKSRKTRPDITEVFTSQNVLKDTDFLDNAVLKFKIDDSKVKTYKEITPFLKEMGEVETHPSIVTVNSMNKATALSIVGNVWSYVVINGLIIIIFLSMILATTTFYFETYKKKIAVKRLYGMSFFETYKSLFGIVVVQGTLYFVFALVQTNVGITLEALGIYFVLEILIIILILLKLQKGLFLNVLKGE